MGIPVHMYSVQGHYEITDKMGITDILYIHMYIHVIAN